MRAAILLSVVALAAGAPKKLSSKFLSTPMARGGGQIVGGTEASPGEFPHQIALLRGGVGGSLMCGGSLISPMKDSFTCSGVSTGLLVVVTGIVVVFTAASVVSFSLPVAAALVVLSVVLASVG